MPPPAIKGRLGVKKLLKKLVFYLPFMRYFGKNIAPYTGLQNDK